MVALIAAIAVMVTVALAELIHFFRCRKVAYLAFGPRRIPALWATLSPLLRVASFGAVVWGLVTLFTLPPRVHRAETVTEQEVKHVVLVLDVSPSMRLQDAGPEGAQSRLHRAADVMESFFQRVPLEQYRISVVAVYSGAKPVVIDTTDIEVVRNILRDLPMHYAFQVGKTDLFAGMEEAAKVAKPWRAGSTTVLMITDGDSVPATGTPKMPISVRDVVLVGIGDPRSGKFIDGRQSRQETSFLRQIAARMGGIYHDGNEKHLSTDLLQRITQSSKENPWERLTLREYALIAIAAGGLLLALLPVLLHYVGTTWQPGIRKVGSSPAAERKSALLPQPPGPRPNPQKTRSRTESEPAIR